MKELIVLFVYDYDGPQVTIGGDPSRSAVGLDINDGRVYDLWLYDDDTEACSVAEFLSVQKEITYDEVRKLALKTHEKDLIKDASLYDALNESSWREFVRELNPDYYYVVNNKNEYSKVKMNTDANL